MVMNEELAQELKNAIAAYGLLLHAAILGTELPPKFEALKTLSEEKKLSLEGTTASQCVSQLLKAAA